MTQNCKLDKRVGSRIWVKKNFITATPGSRLDAFVYVLEIEGYNIEQLCDLEITKESIVSISSEV
jgi:hypothetical protein